MRPQRLRLKGFTSFKDGADVSFEKLDRFAICGPTGAGKSSLLDALTFALFAEAPRRGTGNLANLISLGRKSFAVSLDFSVGGRTFRVARVRRRSGAGSDQLDQLNEAGRPELVATGERAVTEKVETLLGLNYDHFTQAVFLPQGRFAEFLKAKPAERRRLLNELLRLLVYERMQVRAGKERDTHNGKRAQTERRLSEDFAGVTEEARAELERQHQEQLRIVADADAELPGLRERWDEARRDREWTIEVEAKQAALASHHSEQPGIEAARQAVDAANRAAGVIPLLRQEKGAREEDELRQVALRKATEARDVRRNEHQAASDELNRANEAARSLPELRQRLNLLNVAKGKLGLRDQLLRQIGEHRGLHDALAAARVKTTEAAAHLASSVSTTERALSGARADVEAIAFDEEQFRRLERERAIAIRLQSDRSQLAAVLDQAQKEEESAAALATAAEGVVKAEEDAQGEVEAARNRVEKTEQALRTTEAAHAAAHLRAGLQPGQACPVCRQNVAQIPGDETLPVLEQLGEGLAAAKADRSGAEGAASQAGRAAAAARATAAASRRRAEECRSDSARHQQEVAATEQALLKRVADLLGCAKAGPVEEQVLTAAGQAAERQTRHRQAADRASELQTNLALSQKDLEARASEIDRLDNDLRVTVAKIATDTQALGAVQGEIRTAAGTDEPAAECERVQGEISGLEGELAAAAQSERDASNRLRLAETLTETCKEEAAKASARAAETQAEADKALRQAGFPDSAEARAAHLTPQQIKSIQDRISEYEATARALDHRIAELEAALQGRRVTAQECEEANRAHDVCARRREAAETQAALHGQQLRDIQARLERAEALRAELVVQERLYLTFDWLARDLRNNRFQAYLLEETLSALVGDASCRLTGLTGERYGLAFEDDRIFVIDHDNAGERRGIDTLSGGETFLASLALALALSGQVQKAAGAVHLDSLFIDEGFGTLDPETLRTVSDAIRGLQVGGRMVGIITHVPELKDEFDQRLLVGKEGGTSRVHLDVS
jgi:exonuclease SbcC